MKFLTPLLLTLFLLFPSHSQGISADSEVAPKIIGGMVVDEIDYPWMVSFQNTLSAEDVGHFCGGIQFAPEWIVTAAHCFVGSGNRLVNFGGIRAVIGKRNIGNVADSNKLELAQVMTHSKYRIEGWDYDIAVVRLKKPNYLSSYPNLPSAALLEGLEPNREVRVAGWGYVDNEDTFLADLRDAPMELLSAGVCQQVSIDNIEITDNMICAIGTGQAPEGGATDACGGDSGGPLIYRYGSHQHILGVVSWGSTICADEGVPTFFSKIPAYLQWIYQQTGEVAVETPLVLTHFTLPEGIFLSGATASPFDLKEERSELRAVLQGQSSPITFALNAQQSGRIELNFSSEGSDSQTVTFKLSDDSYEEVVSGNHSRYTFELELVAGQTLQVAFSGQSQDQLTISSIHYGMNRSGDSSGKSGGGSAPFYTLLLLVVLTVFRRFLV